jgi:hypothetical protein
MGDMKNPCKILFENVEGKRPFGRTKRRWEVNIRLHLGEIGWVGVD